MPIPFKFYSCKIFSTNLNAANSLGLGSKKCSEYITLNNIYRFLITIFFVNIKKVSKREKKYKTLRKIVLPSPGFEPEISASHSCTDHYTTLHYTCYMTISVHN